MKSPRGGAESRLTLSEVGPLARDATALFTPSPWGSGNLSTTSDDATKPTIVRKGWGKRSITLKYVLRYNLCGSRRGVS